MNEIEKIRTFVDTGSYQREKEDLSYHVFNDMNFYESKRHISFFRSDFRGSSFFNVKFYRNNLDRADFISCNFRSCSFDSTDFGGCEIKNCYFEDAAFKGNKYNGTALYQCTFVNCNFCDEQFLITMYECKFIDCSFANCGFEQSSTEKLEFLRCKITDTNFATMHAERHTFISCKLEGVCLGISYVFGYLFCDTNIEVTDFLYRGEKVFINNSYEKLYSESRYFEYINAKVINKKLDNISNIIIDSIEHLCLNKIVQFRQTELNSILEAIFFYFRYSILPFRELTNLLDFLDQFNWQQFTFEETLNYLGKVEMIKHIMSTGEYQLNSTFINTIPRDDFALVSIMCETDNYNDALAASEGLIKSILGRINMPDEYYLVDKKHGSWELFFVIPILCAILLPIVFKNFTGVILEFTFKKRFLKSLLAKLDDIRLLKDYKSIAETAEIVQIIYNDSKDLSTLHNAVADIIKPIKSLRIGI
jgi:uncharacterized protein YjbI with pentapeptide repeats